MKINLSEIVLTITLTTLFLAGCSGDMTASPASAKTVKDNPALEQPKTVRIAWWGNQTRNNHTQEVLHMYSKAHPDTVLIGEYVDWNGYWDKLAMQTAANNLPDIIQMDYSYIGQYADKNLLVDLLPYSAKGKGYLDLKGIPGDFLSPGIIDGRLYGISLGINALVVFYDPVVFEEAGIESPTAQWSWKQYEELLSKVYRSTGKQSDPLLYRDPIYILEYLVRQHGASLYSYSGKMLGFSDPEIVQQLFELINRLTVEKIYVSPNKVPVNSPLEESPFVKGDSFMGYGWSNQFVATADAAGKPLEMVSLPLDGVYKGLYNKPAMFFSVTAASPYIDQSVRFIDYFINDISANGILVAERGVPIAPKVVNGLKNSVDISTKATFDYINKINYLDKVVGTPVVPAPAAGIQVNELMKDLYNQVVFGKLSPNDAANKFMKQANIILGGAL
jgi:multiple sugar transport system substrate-binding protein